MSTDPKSQPDPYKPEQNPDIHTLYGGMGRVAQQLESIEQFIARRFDELSMEINAMSQQIDMNKDAATKRFNEIFELLKVIPHNNDKK